MRPFSQKFGLNLNKRLMFATRFFIELKSIYAVVQLFYLSRGLNPSEVIYLSLVWSATTLLSDLPSSIVADRFGRKKTIMLGIFLVAVSTAILFFAEGFWQIVPVHIIGALGVSFFSGADQALLYDSLKELKDEKSVNRVAGKYFSAASLPKIVIPLLGSYVARNLLPKEFLILIVIDFIGMITALIISAFLTEPKIKYKLKTSLEYLKVGIKLILQDKILLKLALNKIMVLQAAFVYWRIYQIVLQNAQMPIIYLGVVYTVFQGITFVTHWNTEKVQKFFGPVGYALIPQILGFVGILFSLLSTNLVVIFASCVAVILVGTFRDPFFLTQMQARIPSANRATATSALNTIKNSSDIPLLLLIGYLASININYVLVVSGMLFVLSIIFLRIKKEDLKISL